MKLRRLMNALRFVFGFCFCGKLSNVDIVEQGIGREISTAHASGARRVGLFGEILEILIKGAL